MHQHGIIAGHGFAHGIFALVNPGRRIYALSGTFFKRFGELVRQPGNSLIVSCGIQGHLLKLKPRENH